MAWPIVRNFVITVSLMQCNLAELPGVGMDMVCCVLSEAQQECFRWANEVANGAVGTAPVHFSKILGKAQMCRVSSLAPCQLQAFGTQWLTWVPPRGLVCQSLRAPTPALVNGLGKVAT